MELAKNQVELIQTLIDQKLSNTAPWRIVAGTALASWLLAYFYGQLTHKV